MERERRPVSAARSCRALPGNVCGTTIARGAAARIGAVVVMCLAGSAQGQTLFQPHAPDFYQHQRAAQALSDGNPIPAADHSPPVPLLPRYDPPAGNAANQRPNWWEHLGGWCATTAWTNAFYQQQQRNPNDAFRLWDRSQAPRNAMDPAVAPGDVGRSWIQRMAYENENVAIYAGAGAGGGCISASGASSYLTDRGFAHQMICYFWDGSQPAGQRVRIRDGMGGSTADPNHATLFDVYRDMMRTDSSVVMQLERQMGDNPQWWGNFHVVTGAGVSMANQDMWFADPNDTFRGANWGRRYRDAGEMSPNPGEPAVPIGGDAFPDQLRDYSMATIAADGRTFANGTYQGSAIQEIWTLRVPTPSSAVIAAMMGIVMCRRRRGGAC